jgi:N-acetylglucosamine kinase-like BadF-type ATPase
VTLLLALDGGNSKTDAVLFHPDGGLVARLRGGGSGGGPAQVASTVAALLADLVLPTDARAEPVTGCVAAVAGLDFPEDRPAFESALRAVLPDAAVLAMNDARAVLAVAGREHAIAVVCGAGLNVAAQGPAGPATVPALGWISGDWGGGDALGREAVVIGYRSSDGRGPASALEREVLRATGQEDYPSLARAIRDRAVAPAAVAELARLVTAAAASGDGPAAAALERAVAEVLALVLEVGGRAWGGEVAPGTRVLLAGGLFADPGFRGAVEAGLARAELRAEPLRHPPVFGVVREACRMAGLPAEAERRILTTLEEEER